MLLIQLFHSAGKIIRFASKFSKAIFHRSMSYIHLSLQVTLYRSLMSVDNDVTGNSGMVLKSVLKMVVLEVQLVLGYTTVLLFFVLD